MESFHSDLRHLEILMAHSPGIAAPLPKLVDCEQQVRYKILITQILGHS